MTDMGQKSLMVSDWGTLGTWNLGDIIDLMLTFEQV